MSTRIAFKRVLVGFQQSAPDRAAVRLAAELAGLLRVDLCCMCIEDPGLSGLAAYPGRREFRVLGRHWSPLDSDQLSREIDLHARAVRRLFDEAARRAGVQGRFETVRAAVGEALRSLPTSGDIVIISEPQSPSERVLAPFPQLVRAAFQSKATVFYIPRRIVRRSGPVVAVATSRDDASIAVATAVAASAGESVVVLEVTDGADGAPAAPRGEGAGVSAGEVPTGRLRVARRALSDIASLSAALRGLDERMVVLGRSVFRADDVAMPSAFAALRGVPVLLVGEPAGGEGSEADEAA
ncbi:hypothetical protein [Microbaculum marinum]|uniref:Universal stress protein n=1 Tax=Microbaculum marinum TaxID=1764581 RepID=A0AAW9RSP4_9HYPH